MGTTAQRARRNRGLARLALVVIPALSVLLAPPVAQGAFGIDEFDVVARKANGTIQERAASHPFTLDIHLAMNVDQEGEPEGTLRKIQTDLPPGLIGNPLATARCPMPDFQLAVPRCGGATQIGILHGIVTGIGLISTPIYNLQPLLGDAATFGVSVEGETYLQRLSLTGAGADSALRFEMALPPEPAIVDLEEELWGTPADPAHDPERSCLDSQGGHFEGCFSEAEEQPFLTLPASCAEPLRTTLTAVSLADPPEVVEATALSRDAGGNPRPLAGCDSVPFDPGLSLRGASTASAPTPLSLQLDVPQDESGELASASLAVLDLELPPGVSLNPAAGSWLGGCSVAQLEGPSGCPASSTLGSVELRTPPIDHPLKGSIFLGVPTGGPGDPEHAIYLVIEDEETGTTIKVRGRLRADLEDGRLGVVIADLPQIPLEELDLDLSGGPRAPLAAPPQCGEYSAQVTFTPSSAPFAPSVPATSPLSFTTGPGGGPCPPPEEERSAVPSFEAGTPSPAAGTEAPLVIRLSREDVDQRFGSFDFTLPPGLLADLGSVSLGSRVGSVQVRAGVGPEPLTLKGSAYLEGPYGGAPYSLALAVPAQVGPFDLGTITERVAVEIDPVTAQIGVRADPLPQILGGVPLGLRDLRIDLDRPGFIRNPTSCKQAAITGSATTALGQTVPLSARFGVVNCRGLPFKPKLSFNLSGALGRGGHPGVRAVLRTDPDGAALSNVSFLLPAGELLDLRHLRRLCPRGVAAERCPAGSRLGSLRLESPLLADPLVGTVQLRVPSRRLPDLTTEVRGGGIRFLLRGRTFDRGGRLGISLDSLPDVPLSQAVLTLPGGRRGIVVNSESLCAAGPASASFSAHSGKQRRTRVPVRLSKPC